MEIELSQKTIDQIAYKVCLMLQKKTGGPDQPEMVTTREAARILCISEGRMRQIKNRFPHIKNGDSAQGKLLFKRDALLAEYAK